METAIIVVVGIVVDAPGMEVKLELPFCRFTNRAASGTLALLLSMARTLAASRDTLAANVDKKKRNFILTGGTNDFECTWVNVNEAEGRRERNGGKKKKKREKMQLIWCIHHFYVLPNIYYLLPLAGTRTGFAVDPPKARTYHYGK